MSALYISCDLIVARAQMLLNGVQTATCVDVHGEREHLDRSRTRHRKMYESEQKGGVRIRRIIEPRKDQDVLRS